MTSEKVIILQRTYLPKGVAESYFCDSESALNESDIQALVERVVDVIKNHGMILADTFSYDYDPMPQVCFYNDGETVAKLLDVDGEEFQSTVDIRNEWDVRTCGWDHY